MKRVGADAADEGLSAAEANDHQQEIVTAFPGCRMDVISSKSLRIAIGLAIPSRLCRSLVAAITKDQSSGTGNTGNSLVLGGNFRRGIGQLAFRDQVILNTRFSSSPHYGLARQSV